MRIKKKNNYVFVCQIADNAFKIIKCAPEKNAKQKFTNLGAEAITTNIEDKELTQKISGLFKKLEYNNQPVIISLPRSKATCRYIKVPAQAAQEIDKMVALQAPRHLPYPADELTTGYQVISTDKEGFSHLIMVIVQKDSIQQYVRTFKEIKITNLSIVLSSYGLTNLYNYIKPNDPGATIIIEADSLQTELAIVSEGKLLSSRCFKINQAEPDWKQRFFNEINNSRDAYLKEAAGKPPSKIAVTGSPQSALAFSQALNELADLPAEELPLHKISFSENSQNNIFSSEYSFANLLGLGLLTQEESLNLLPPLIKEEKKRILQNKELLNLALLILGTVLMLGLAIAKNLDNKKLYLQRVKKELAEISKEAKPLEEIEKRLKIISGNSRKDTSSLDLILELYQVIPSDVFLVNFSYEENKQLILRGQAAQLNSVFAFFGKLENSPVMKSFEIKVRYATERKAQAGKFIDFEITCIKK